MLTIAELANAVNNLSKACLLSGREDKSELSTQEVSAFAVFVPDKYGMFMCCSCLPHCQNLSSYYESTEGSAAGHSPVCRTIDCSCDQKPILLTNQYRKRPLSAFIYSYISIIHQGCCLLKA